MLRVYTSLKSSDSCRLLEEPRWQGAPEERGRNRKKHLGRRRTKDYFSLRFLGANRPSLPYGEVGAWGQSWETVLLAPPLCRLRTDRRAFGVLLNFSWLQGGWRKTPAEKAALGGSLRDQLCSFCLATEMAAPGQSHFSRWPWEHAQWDRVLGVKMGWGRGDQTDAFWFTVLCWLVAAPVSNLPPSNFLKSFSC